MTQPQTMDHQTNDVLPVALHHLRAVGCNTLDPFTLALAAWHGDWVESLKTARERQQFQGLHLAACKLLDVEPHAPDLRSLDERDDDSIRALGDAYRWAGAAHSDPRPPRAGAARLRRARGPRRSR